MILKRFLGLIEVICWQRRISADVDPMFQGAALLIPTIVQILLGDRIDSILYGSLI